MILEWTLKCLSIVFPSLISVKTFKITFDSSSYVSFNWKLCLKIAPQLSCLKIVPCFIVFKNSVLCPICVVTWLPSRCVSQNRNIQLNFSFHSFSRFHCWKICWNFMEEAYIFFRLFEKLCFHWCVFFDERSLCPVWPCPWFNFYYFHRQVNFFVIETFTVFWRRLSHAAQVRSEWNQNRWVFPFFRLDFFMSNCLD